MSLTEERYILNVNDGVDTIHRAAGLTENCNTDDVVGKKNIDVATAAAMLDKGQAVRCQHCNKE
jgi:hypothetical protein